MSYNPDRRKARAEERRAEFAALDPDVVTKQCMGCEETKPLSAFSVSLNSRLGRHSHCRMCRPRQRKSFPGAEATRIKQNEARRRKYAEDPEFRKAQLRANRDYRYGLKEGQYEEMLAAQGGGCAVCGTTEPRGHGDFHVDHDHTCCPGILTCGKCIRGLLCASCNTGLGMFNDNIDALMSAAAYLIAGLTGQGRPNLSASVMRQNPVAGA